MSELERLQQQLADLTKWRNDTVSAAEKTIKETNRHFDREAYDLHRQIKKLLPPDEETVVTPVTRNTPQRRKARPTFTLDGTDGWTQEEIDHYRELHQART